MLRPMADEAPTPSPVMFNPLRPRTHLDQDELGRKGFVRSVWRALRNHDASEAIVISIQAPWGDGKTTLKEMVVTLEETEGKRKKLLFVHFNPWEWAAQNQVATAFFGELTNQLEAQGSNKVVRAAAKGLASAFSQLPSCLGIGAVIANSTSLALSSTHPEAATVAGATGAALKVAEESMKKVQEAQKAAGTQSPTSPEKVKEKVRAACQKFREQTGRNIVVFIDDIDRLSGDEIRQVLQLVKINADFPGLIFVLLFDKEYVERRLRRHFGSDAGRFLEKIVQVELTLPKASEDQLYGTFKTAVQDALKKRPAYLAIFEEDRLKQAFDVWFQYHLVNPRKSGRLVSGWAFRLDVFDTGAAEVNPVDLLILEGIALYEPEVYLALSRAYDELFEDDSIEFFDRMLSEEAGEKSGPSRRIQALNRIAQKVQVTTSLEMVAVLKLIMSVGSDDFRDVQRPEAEHRIRHSRFSEGRFFRRYFRLSIDSGDVSKVTIQSLMKAIGTAGKFPKELTDLEGQGVLLDALDQLLAEKLSPPRQLSLFLSDLLDWWEERILRRGRDMQDTGLAHALIRLYEQLMGMREGKDRSGVLLTMLQQTTAVFALVDLVFHEQRKRLQREDEKSSDTTGLVDKEAELELCQEVARRILQHFKSNPPMGQPHENEACAWTLHYGGSWRPDIGKELLRTAGGLVVLMKGPLGGLTAILSVEDRKVVPQVLAPMVEFELLRTAVQTQLKQLIVLDQAATDWSRKLDQIGEAMASDDGQEATVDPA
jgi:predicted KAP-like P-loop ATPase